MQLKLSFETEGYELCLKKIPKSIIEFRNAVAKELKNQSDKLKFEYYDFEKELVTINDELDYQYFVENYQKKASLLFVEIKQEETVSFPISKINTLATHNSNKKNKKQNFDILKLLDKAEITAISKISEIVEKVTEKIYFAPKAEKQRRSNFKKHICINCESSSPNQTVYICLHCNYYILCDVCESKIKHDHPMALVKGDFDEVLESTDKLFQQIQEAKTNKNHYCKQRILKSLFGQKLTELEKRDFVWKYYHLTNEEFLHKIDYLLGGDVLAKN